MEDDIGEEETEENQINEEVSMETEKRISLEGLFGWHRIGAKLLWGIQKDQFCIYAVQMSYRGGSLGIFKAIHTKCVF